MLSGDNGILQRAADAKTKSEEAQVRERIRLAYNSALTKDVTNQNEEVQKLTLEDELENEFPNKTIEITESTDKKEWIIAIDDITENVPIGKDTPQVATLPSGNGTKPYFPSTAFSQVEGTDLSTGLVITDKAEKENVGNEYVWIEVPSTYVDNTVTTGPNYSSVSNSTDYTNISIALRNYCTKDINSANLIAIGTSSDGTYGSTSTYGYTDTWYDGNGKITSESSNTSDTTGCGLTSTQYTTLYHKMLKSVYGNGGFWIGRYEAGQSGDTGRENKNDSIYGILPLSQPNLIPIFNITCSQAQTIAGNAKNLDNTKYTSSLMFGIQWDLVLRHLSNKGIETNILTNDSSSWGNFSNTTNASLTGGKYTQYMNSSYQNTFNTWISYDVDLGEFIQGKTLLKNAGMPQGILLTTGISSKFNKKNIYDLAGNLDEFTLEMSTATPSSAAGPCTARGLCFPGSGAVAYRCGVPTTGSLTPYNDGFRICIY